MTPQTYLVESARTECDQRAALIRLTKAEGQGRLPTLSVDNVSLLHGLVGCMNELGELTTLVQKWLWYGKPFTEGELRARVRDEGGDLLWHFSQVLRRFGLTYEELMAANIAKLQVRYPDAGWSAERAEEGARNRAAEHQAQADRPGAAAADARRYADRVLNEPLRVQDDPEADLAAR